MLAKIKRWYVGHYLPYDGFYERHWTANAARAVVGFYLREWKWCWGTAMGIAGLLVYKIG